jgi:hypothetical protein
VSPRFFYLKKEEKKLLAVNWWPPRALDYYKKILLHSTIIIIIFLKLFEWGKSYLVGAPLCHWKASTCERAREAAKVSIPLSCH